MASEAGTKVQQEEVLNVTREFVMSVVSSSKLAPHLYRDATNHQASGTDHSGIGYRPSEDD